MKRKVLAAFMVMALGLTLTACSSDSSSSGEEIPVTVSETGSLEDDDTDTYDDVDEDTQDNISETENGSANSNADSSSAAQITEDEALEIALTDAGLSEDELTGARVKTGTEHGASVYEVDLYAEAEEYAYEIDAVGGDILDKEYEYDEGYSSSVTVPSGVIARDEAIALVLARVDGATEWDLRIKLDTDDGQYVWEGDLYYESVEYEFEIGGTSGTFLEWESENER